MGHIRISQYASTTQIQIHQAPAVRDTICIRQEANMIVIGQVVHTVRTRSLRLSLPSVSEKTMLLKDGGTRRVRIEFENHVEVDSKREFVKVRVALDYCGEGEILSGVMHYKDRDGGERAVSDAKASDPLITSWFVREEKFFNIRKISLYIQILSDKALHAKHEAEIDMQRNSISALAKDFASMIKTALMADVTIVCDGARFPVHKLILSARSEVFAAMLSHEDTLESQRREIVVEDTSKRTMDVFLGFIYEAAQPKNLSFEGLAELLIVAHRYQVQSLVDVCFMKLRENMSTDNAILGAILGSLYGNQKLQKDAIRLIVKAETNLSSLDGYEELRSYPDLHDALIDYCYGERECGKSGKRRRNSTIGFDKRARN